MILNGSSRKKIGSKNCVIIRKSDKDDQKLIKWDLAKWDGFTRGGDQIGFWVIVGLNFEINESILEFFGTIG